MCKNTNSIEDISDNARAKFPLYETANALTFIKDGEIVSARTLASYYCVRKEDFLRWQLKAISRNAVEKQQ